MPISPSYLKGRATKLRRHLATTMLATLAVLSQMPVQAKSADLLPVRVAGADAINSATPLFVAMRKGFFKDVGLDVTYVTMGGAAPAMSAALKAGELDIGLGGAIQYMDDIAKGVLPGKLVGEFTDNVYVILGAKGITDIKQLKGKIFGISNYNGGDQLYSQAVLRHFGIGPDDITWVPVGTPASRLSALLSGRIDGMELSVTSMPDGANGHVILSADDSPVPFVSSAIFARQGFITSNRPELQKFLAAIGKGADWARSHPDDAMLGCQDSGSSAALCKTAIDIATQSKNAYTWSSTARLNAEALRDMIPIVATDVPKAKGMKLEDFADTTIAAAKP